MHSKLIPISISANASLGGSYFGSFDYSNDVDLKDADIVSLVPILVSDLESADACANRISTKHITLNCPHGSTGTRNVVVWYKS